MCWFTGLFGATETFEGHVTWKLWGKLGRKGWWWWGGGLRNDRGLYKATLFCQLDKTQKNSSKRVPHSDFHQILNHTQRCWRFRRCYAERRWTFPPFLPVQVGIMLSYTAWVQRWRVSWEPVAWRTACSGVWTVNNSTLPVSKQDKSVRVCCYGR